MKRTILSVLVTLIFTALIGCSGFDSTQMLVHPESVSVSSSFDVALVNLFTYVDTAKTVSKKVTRDSLHLLVGLPESWSVLGARMVKVAGMKTQEMLALQSGVVDAGMIQKYMDLAVVLPADNALPATLKGQTVSAHSATTSTSVEVAIDKVKQWKGFSAPVDIVLNKGDKYDTILPFDSVVSFALASGMMPDSVATTVAALKSSSLFKIPDTIGISVVPVAIFLKIQASSIVGNDTLYYFTKTDSMNPKPSPEMTLFATLGNMPSLKKVESGSMTFAAVAVTSTAVVRQSAARAASGMHMVTEQSTGSVHITLGRFDPARTSIGIYSLQGTLLITLTPHSKSVVWNGCTTRGQKLPAGTYFVRVSDAAGSVVQAVQLLR